MRTSQSGDPKDEADGLECRSFRMWSNGKARPATRAVADEDTFTDTNTCSPETIVACLFVDC